MKWHREWFIRVPWGKLALVSRGHPDGEPVLLVHGRQDSLSIFEPLIKQMSEQYYYVAIDMPGNGLSDAFPHVTNEPLPHGDPNYAVVFEKPPRPARPFIDFNKFCQRLVYTNKTGHGPKLMRFHFLYAMELALIHLGWDRFIFMGHSMGCEQGLFYNVLYPGQITKMILLDAGPTLMRMQIEDNAEYQRLFYDSYYDNYKKENLGRKIRHKYTVTQSMQRLRDLSRAQCNHLLTRNFHEIPWHPIQGWHPNEIQVVARKTFVVAFNYDQNDNEKLLPNGTRTMVLWNLNENDLIKLDDHVVLKQCPVEPLNIYACGEKVNLIIHLTKNAYVETMTEFPVDTTDIVSQDDYDDNSDENESIDEQSSVGGDSNNNHDIPSGVPKDLGPAEQIFFLRTKSHSGTSIYDEEQRPAEGKSNEAVSSVSANEAQDLVEDETNETRNSFDERSNNTQRSGEGDSNGEKISLEGNEDRVVNEGNLTEETRSYKKRYYYCDVCVVYSKVLGHRDIRNAQRLENLEKQLLKMINNPSSYPESTVSIGCETLSQIPNYDQNLYETNSNWRTSFESGSTTPEDFDEARSPGEGLCSNLSLALNKAQSSYVARNVMDPQVVKQNIREENFEETGTGDLSDTEMEDLSLTANTNCVAEDPAPLYASQARSSNERSTKEPTEAQNANDSLKLSVKGNSSRDHEERSGGVPDEADDVNGPQNGNGSENSGSRDVKAQVGLVQRLQENDSAIGYLSWDDRLKNLAPQNYGNDYYFELFKSIPPTLLIAASDGAKNVPPIPKWRQGAKELLDKMATLDNFHRVDVEGSHDVHYTHPERVLPFINSFLKDNRVSSKL